MSSPTRGPVRRRQRSARAAVACLLLTTGAVAVVTTTLSGSRTALAAGAAVGVFLGVLATRITYLEVLQSRREAAADRAELAQEYRSLTDERVDANTVFTAELSGRIARHEATIERLEKRLGEATVELTEAQAALDEALDLVHRAEDENGRLANRLADAEERAAVAIVKLAELEQERDVLVAEWQAADARERFAAG